ncbi:MAG TPA: DNA replication/repair protein RecF [Thermoanaerobacterales bacterium]|nr:DNA replication/repair protein RecF [Thermoanaerobacterales bacterium]
MDLQNLRLYDFRNFSETDANFEKGINIFYGDNAQGKTNILEAIYFLTALKPVRAFREQELIKHDRSVAFLQGIFNTRAGPLKRQVKLYSDRKKEVREGEIIKTRLSELAKGLGVVYFSPDDLEIIKGQPSGRRKFIDNFIFQIRPGFYKYLQGYQRVLSQRNSLLKALKNNKKMMQTLDSWDEQLAEYGFQLINERFKLLQSLSNLAIKYFENFSHEGTVLKIKYVSSVNFTDTGSIKGELRKALTESRNKDILRSYTSVGPHRDDIEFLINGKNARLYGSQGQQRTVVLCLKFSQRDILSTIKGENPILLLDDVMSELDIYRRRLILEREDHQVFITTTDLNFIPDEIIKKSSLYSVKAGVLR